MLLMLGIFGQQCAMGSPKCENVLGSINPRKERDKRGGRSYRCYLPTMEDHIRVNLLSPKRSVDIPRRVRHSEVRKNKIKRRQRKRAPAPFAGPPASGDISSGGARTRGINKSPGVALQRLLGDASLGTGEEISYFGTRASYFLPLLSTLLFQVSG